MDYSFPHRSYLLCIIPFTGRPVKLKPLFCWEAPTGENAQWLWDLARRYGIGELYVAFPEHPSAQEEFLRAAQEEGLAVYWLTGDPSWAMEPEGSEMLRQVEQAGALHTAHSETLRGIVFDVEPYLLDEWDEDADALMRSFALSLIHI